MPEHQPEQVIDLTAKSDQLRYVEIITRGGVIRVSTNLVGVHNGGKEHVVVEIMPSARALPCSGDGGHWATDVRERLSGRIDVTLIREEA